MRFRPSHIHRHVHLVTAPIMQSLAQPHPPLDVANGDRHHKHVESGEGCVRVQAAVLPLEMRAVSTVGPMYAGDEVLWPGPTSATLTLVEEGVVPSLIERGTCGRV